MSRIPSRYLNLSDDFAFTGNVTVPAPLGVQDAVSKNYVETQISSGSQGVAGAQGFAGTNGTSGAQGFTGVNGTNGTQGFAGANGTSGVQGFAGTNGTSGTQGFTGSNGTSGAQGLTGANGTSGVQGFAGTNGTSGAQGLSGVNGTNGAQGFTGANGTSGTQGFTGTNGTSGTQGFTGIQGATGFQGFTGIGGSGPQGARGFTGTQGVLSGETNVLFSGNISDVTVTASVVNTTETTLLGTVTGTKTIAANALSVGKTIRCTVRGILTSSNSSVPDIRIRLKLGSVAIFDSGSVFQPSGNTTGDAFCQDWTFLVRASGGSGSITGTNILYYSDHGSTYGLSSTTTATVNTTTTQTVDLTIQYTSNTSGNNLLIRSVLFEII